MQTATESTEILLMLHCL